MRHLLLAAFLAANLEGLQVVSGDVTVQQEGQNTTYNCAYEKTILNHDSFHIDQGHRVHFQQPSSKSSVLNRVTGKDPSRILGKLSSNGNVFLINSNGIVISRDGQVNTNSFVASTLDIEDNDFLRGKYRFKMGSNAKEASIRNQGMISAENNIALLAAKILNEGTIVAKAGKVALLASEIVTLDFAGDGLMSVEVEGQLEKAIIEHLGSISASSGEVVIRLATARDLLERTLNIDGVEIGTAMEMENGIVRILAASTLHAPKVSIQGQSVEMSGQLTACNSLDISTYGDGNLTFNSTLKGPTDLKLFSENGTVHLKGDVGDSKARVKSLSIKGKIIDQDGAVYSSGKVEYSGRIYLGGGINTTNKDIVFNGPVIRDSVNGCLLTTGYNQGDVIFGASLDADKVSRNLQVFAGSGNARFYGPVGLEGALGDLNVTANSISVADIGTLERAGVADHSYMNATGENGLIDLNGQIYHAGRYDWAARKFPTFAKQHLHLKSRGGDCTFNDGMIEAASDVELHISLQGGELRMAGFNGMGKNDVFIDGGGGSMELVRFENIRNFHVNNGAIKLVDVQAENVFIDSCGKKVELVGTIAIDREIHVKSKGLEITHSLEAKEFKARAGMGDVILDSTMEIAGPFHLSGRDIYIKKGFHVENLQVDAQGSIYSGQRNEIVPVKRMNIDTGQPLLDPETGKEIIDKTLFWDPICSDNDIYLNAKGPYIGIFSAPLAVETSGALHIGCSDSATVVGKIKDNTLQLIPGNEPYYYHLNGIELWGKMFGGDFGIFQEEKLISLTPDFLTRGRGDYVDASSIKPRRALLFYTPNR